MQKTVSFKIEDNFLEELETLSREVHLTKSALIKQSLKFYLDNYDGIIAKTRDEDPDKKLIDHEDVLKEYGLL
ncbi:MAG: hypothetical protein GXO90_02295 [FCB group bacterium]|nr:hypothetical protein [FCB group bacterium]